MVLSKKARVIPTAIALVLAGCVITSDGHPFSASAESSPTTADRPAALDGTYRVDVFGSRGTFDGESYPNQDSARWYAITTSCSAAGCTAHAARLDDGDHEAPHPSGRTLDMTFERGRWTTDAIADTAPCLADPERTVPLSVVWQLEPHTDGTLSGVRTLTEQTDGSGPCAGSGGTYEVPTLFTRVHDLPR